ncbi:amidase domain-containing protein [uncultured Clostridium sp.]|uniref:amidase domain-containing protein n=1 Tax=uncultured Clostridium sp. TaxID=59620 RepID=UPI0025E50E58|nr:amidase domain-containing protein [uncultured Clostridium sp.]
MLCSILYNLCSFINSPYLHSTSDTSDISHFLCKDIYDSINERLNFKIALNKKNNFPIEHFKFSFKYKILEQNSNLIKVHLTIKNSFIFNPSISDIHSCSNNDYVVIAEYTLKSNLKIYALISKEENPIIFNSILEKNLDTIENILPLNTSNILNIDLINNIFKKENILKKYDAKESLRFSNFNVDNACSYAEKFALTPNPEYISYEKNGGDCTNFASQILLAGGLKKTYTWTPYSNAWLRVEELYSYLLYNKLAYRVNDKSSDLKRGTLIQFNIPQTGRYSHTGFITHKLSNGECLYCCHTYNKLNYPLSYIYPILYPDLRGLNFY